MVRQKNRDKVCNMAMLDLDRAIISQDESKNYMMLEHFKKRNFYIHKIFEQIYIVKQWVKKRRRKNVTPTTDWVVKGQ